MVHQTDLAASGPIEREPAPQTEAGADTVRTGGESPRVMAVPTAHKARFISAFKQFLDTLEEASAYGPAHSLETKYATLHRELRRSYADLRDELRPAVSYVGDENALGFDFHGIWSDPFERLLRSESLEEALKSPAPRVEQESRRAVEALRRWKRTADGKRDV